jgi:hypothetical protein
VCRGGKEKVEVESRNAEDGYGATRAWACRRETGGQYLSKMAVCSG